MVQKSKINVVSRDLLTKFETVKISVNFLNVYKNPIYKSIITHVSFMP